MESYLMMIYVTLEQESALKTFFLDQGWAYCKPDLSYTTDKLGPAAGTFPNIARDEEFMNNPNTKNATEQSAKRKLQPPTTCTSIFKRSKVTKASEKILEESGDYSEKLGDAKHETIQADKERMMGKIASPITVQDIDGNSKAIKVEVTDEDDEYDPFGNYYGNAGDNSAMNDDYNEDTDPDDSFGQVGDSQMSGSSHLDTTLNTDEDDAQAAGSKRKQDIMNANKREECGVCGKEYTKTNKSRHMKKHAISDFICRVCQKEFTSKFNLKRHENAVHAEVKPHKCDRCDETFAYKWQMMTSWSAEPPDFYTSERAFMLKQGLNWTCGYKPAIKCTFCHKTFTSLSARKRHERTVHAMEKNIQCEHCEEKFAYKWLMEAHAAKKHGIGKLFTCACGQTFNRQSNLTQHANICKSVQGPGNETVCKVCTKKFKCKKYLDVHMKFQHDITTLPSVCNICGESFTRPWSLTRHLKRRHAIVDVLSKDTEGGSVSNMSSKEVDTDSDADVSSKEMKSDADISSKEMKSDAYVSSKEIKSDVEVSRKVNQPDTDMSSKKGKSESVVEMSKKERKSDSSADISSKNINTDSVTVMYSNKVTQESISDVSSVETEPDSLVDLPAKKVKIEEA